MPSEIERTVDDTRPSAPPIAGRGSPGLRACDVTVVVATRDRVDRLAATLGHLRTGSPSSPVIVCDDASEDAAGVAAVAAAAGARLVRMHRGVGAAARNAGVREARTALVAFCDDDSWWAPDALDRAARHFSADARLGLLAGRILVGPDERVDPVSSLMARSPLGRVPAGPRVRGFLACAAVARRAALEAAGGFPIRYGIGGEEAALALDLVDRDWELAYADDVVAHHHPERRPATSSRQVITLRNDLWTVWRRRSGTTAVRRTASVGARTVRDPVARRALPAALAGLPWVLADRRRPARGLESGLRALDHQRRARPGALPPAPPHHVLPRRASAANPDPECPVTVVIAARDGWDRLRRTLAELRALPERPPVIVVDDASSDETAERVAAEHPEVEVVVLDRRCGPVARNVGVDRATTPYVAFCDDDSWWEPESLRRAAGILDSNPSIGVLTGRILIGAHAGEDPISAEMAASPLAWDPDLPGHALASFMGGASVVRREAFVEVGGFEPRLVVGGEEQLLGAEMITAGWAMRYVPALTVHHHPEGERRGEVRALGVRNALWFAWRRRAWRSAAAETAFVLRSSGPRRETVAGALRALLGLPWVIATRRPVPAPIEAGMRRLDADRRTSRAVDFGA